MWHTASSSFLASRQRRSTEGGKTRVPPSSSRKPRATRMANPLVTCERVSEEGCARGVVGEGVRKVVL